MARVNITIRHRVIKFRTVPVKNRRGRIAMCKLPFEAHETKTVSLDRAIYDRLDNPTAALESQLGLRIISTTVTTEDESI